MVLQIEKLMDGIQRFQRFYNSHRKAIYYVFQLHNDQLIYTVAPIFTKLRGNELKVYKT